MNAVIVKNAHRMMLSAALLEDGLEMTFADGCRGLVPFDAIPEITGYSGVSALELPNPYQAIILTDEGQQVELPWDFARHYCDQSYRPMVEAIARQGRHTLGGRIRQLRESTGLTQEALAHAADIGRVTLVRLENGEQTPRFRTLTAIAQALGKQVQDLLTEP